MNFSILLDFRGCPIITLGYMNHPSFLNGLLQNFSKKCMSLLIINIIKIFLTAVLYLDKELKSLMSFKEQSVAALYSIDLVIFRNSMPNADYKEVVTLESLARYQTGRVAKSLVLFSILSTMHVYILSTISLSFH